MRCIAVLFAMTLLSFSVYSQADNALSEKEKKEGWELLFNGKNLDGWHAYGKKAIGPRWKINNGVLELHTGLQEGGDLVTNEIFTGNFECRIDWKIAPSSNSGVFFFTNESSDYEHIYNTALELQIQDNDVYREEKGDKQHLTGDLFGIIKATDPQQKALGQWNQYHVVFKYPILDIFLNSKRIHHINVSGGAWKKLLSTGTHKDSPFAKGKFVGPIGLQDWHSMVYFRNIKIRTIR